MPKILRILNRLIIGGPVINATYLSRYMPPDYETMLVVGAQEEHEQDAGHLTEALGIQPVVVPQMKRSINFSEDRRAYLKLKEIIARFKPDIVHTHAAKSGTLGRLAAKACKVPVIVHTFHGHVFHSYFNPLKTKAFIQIERWLANQSSGIVAISDIQKSELSATYKICPEKKIEVIPLGMDLDKFSVDLEDKRASFRKQYFIADDEVAVGIIGRIVPVKNHVLFIAAAAQAVADGNKKIRFIVVGDGDMRTQMEQACQEAGLDYTYWPESQRVATVTCTSWRMDVDTVMAGLDIVMLTSHNEGTPLSMIEAQAAGKPVVCTRVGGVADVIKEGVTGFITPPGDTAALSEALLQLYANKEQREAFGIAGQAFAQQAFSYQRLVGDMDNYYKRLLANTKAGRKKMMA